ncbi:hypothetical protein RIVM261_078750 [Rivularia sp. IAM M-261]|nr:hypothetical protein RIVM261_078750 [Rivularia sp. IAM M-261]
MHQIIENTQPQYGNQQYNGAFTSNAAPYIYSYSFDYGRFANSDLSDRAKSTLGNFLGFVRHTFDGLLSIGEALQNLYNDCLASCPNGKKVFDSWLDTDFGTTKYIASSAMEIYGWFQSLHPRIQNLIRNNVQSWSVSALRQLKKVSTDFLEEVVSGGKKTAAQVKHAINASSTNLNAGITKNTSAKQTTDIIDTQLAPGLRVVVCGDDSGCDGHSGIIMSKHDDEYCVLMDYTVAQGMETKHLFKPEQLQPELKTGVITSTYTFTTAQVEQKIAEALATRDKEKAEEELGRFVEIQEAALKAAGAEIQSYAQHARSLQQAKNELLQQLETKEQELREVRSLQVTNQQLIERVSELEKALENSTNNAWDNTFSNQATKVLNSQVEKTVAPLMSEVERLQALVSKQENELSIQQEEITKWRQYSTSNTDVEAIIKEFALVGETLGWNGWNRYGYRAVDGTLHKDMSAIASFISDLKQNYYSAEEVVFQN